MKLASKSKQNKINCRLKHKSYMFILALVYNCHTISAFIFNGMEKKIKNKKYGFLKLSFNYI